MNVPPKAEKAPHKPHHASVETRVSPVFAIELFREGVRLATLLSDPISFDKSQEVVNVTCHISGKTLLPGIYDLHLGAQDILTGCGLDWVPNVNSFQILDVHKDDNIRSHKAEKGMVRIPTKWSCGWTHQ